LSSSASSPNGAGRRALVLGAGMAGLAAARVLADHVDRVTVVEQDALPTEASPRRGTPQSRHVHVLLNSGRTILNRLFPGLEDDLGAAGAPVVDGAKDIAWLMTAGWGIRYPSKYIARIASRPLLEATVRRRLTQNPRVDFVAERSVEGLLASEDRSRVHGVRVRPRGDEPGGAEEDLTADLVVDATGRGSRASQWLRAIGYPEPPRTEIDAFLGYASRYYRLPPDPHRSWQGLYVQARLPAELRSGFFFRVENDAWLCTLAGYGRDHPPTDEEGYLAFARSLRAPLLYEAIKDAEPLTPPVAIRSTANVWRHYERLPRWPDGFVALGDAVCAFNPVYGQGMSVAAKEAMVLDGLLRRRRRPDGDLAGLAGQFQRKLPQTIRPAWTMATGEDFRVPQVEGGRPGRSARFLHWYLDRVIQLATEDVFARQAFFEVLNLDRPPTCLFDPRLIAKVILGPTGRAAGPGAARVAPS
jgi:2-polyprenyl-6-methoxyphenol hydroxylase-like FAD-dependent oxidoreductase